MNSTDLRSKTDNSFELFIEKCFGHWIDRLGGPYCFLLILIGIATAAYIILVSISRSGAGDPWDPLVAEQRISRASLCAQATERAASGQNATGLQSTNTTLQATACPNNPPEPGQRRNTATAKVLCSKSSKPWSCGSIRLNDAGFLNITFDEAKLNAYLAREQIVILQEFFRKELDKTQVTLLESRQQLLDEINQFARAKLRAKVPPAPLNFSAEDPTKIDPLLTRSANLKVIKNWLGEFPGMFTPYNALNNFESYADLVAKAKTEEIDNIEAIEIDFIQMKADLENATSKLAKSRSEYQNTQAAIEALNRELKVIEEQLDVEQTEAEQSNPDTEQIQGSLDQGDEQNSFASDMETLRGQIAMLVTELAANEEAVDRDQSLVAESEKRLAVLASWRGQLLGVKTAFNNHQADAARYNSLTKALQLQIDSEINLFTNVRSGAPNLQPPLNFSWLYSDGVWWLVHLFYWTTMGVLLDALFRLNQAVAKKDYDPVQFAMTIPKLISAPFMSLLVVALWGAGFTESGITFVNLPYMMFVFFALGFASNRVTRLVRDATKGVLRGFSLSEDKLRAQYDEARKYRQKYQVNFDLHAAPTSLREVTRQVKAESMQKLEREAIDTGVVEAQASSQNASTQRLNGAAG